MNSEDVGDRPDLNIVALVEQYQLEHNVGFDAALMRIMSSARGRALLAEYNRMHAYQPVAKAGTTGTARHHQVLNAETELQDRVRALLQTNCRMSYAEATREVLMADTELAVRVAKSLAEKCQSGGCNG